MCCPWYFCALVAGDVERFRSEGPIQSAIRCWTGAQVNFWQKCAIRVLTTSRWWLTNPRLNTWGFVDDWLTSIYLRDSVTPCLAPNVQMSICSVQLCWQVVALAVPRRSKAVLPLQNGSANKQHMPGKMIANRLMHFYCRWCVESMLILNSLKKTTSHDGLLRLIHSNIRLCISCIRA